MKTGKSSFAKLHKVIPGLLASLWMMLCLSACTGYGEEVSEGSWKAILKNDHKEAFVCEYQWDGSDEGLRIDARSVNGIPVTRYCGYIGRGLPAPFTIVVPGARAVGITPVSKDDIVATFEFTLVIGPQIRDVFFRDLGGYYAVDDPGATQRTYCKVMIKFEVDPDNTEYYEKDGKLYSKSNKMRVSGINYDLMGLEKPDIVRKTVTDEQGIKTIYVYDRDGKIQIEEKYDASGAVSWSTQYSYDEAGRETLCVMVGPNDEPKSYRKKVYDGDGNLTEEYTGKSPEDARLHYRYTYEDGKLVTEANINEDGSYFDLEFYEYDEQGRLSRKTKQSEDGYVYRLWEYTYTEEGWLGHVTDTHYEHRVETDYDAYGREIREEGFYNDELSYTERFSYGEFGLVSYLFESVSGNKNHYVYYYDEAGRKISEVSVDEDGNETQIAFWEYDDRGNLIHSKKAKGYEYTAEYNEYGYPVKVHDVCTDMTRDAGTYDTLETYEYTYYDTMSAK